MEKDSILKALLMIVIIALITYPIYNAVSLGLITAKALIVLILIVMLVTSFIMYIIKKFN